MQTVQNFMKPLAYLSPKDGFLGLDGEPEDHRATVIPFGIEASVSYGQGTAAGPEAIITASHQVELFDEELWCEPYKKIGIRTLKPFPVKSPIPEALSQLEGITEQVLSEDRFPLILGGEHSLTPGAIRAVARKYPDLALLHFDAHADLRDGYAGEHYSHASALRRCLDNTDIHLVSVGIRNISAGEIPFLEQNRRRLHIYWGKDRKNWNIGEIVSKLGNRPVYVTFDLDGFDASLMPATGTPEPGGIFWDDAVAIIRAAAETHRFVGADIVELAPIPALHGPNFLAAKLAYKILSYAFAL